MYDSLSGALPRATDRADAASARSFVEQRILASGSEPEKLEAGLGDLLVRRLYLEWGLAKIEGLRIDGELLRLITLISGGPEAFG